LFDCLTVDLGGNQSFIDFGLAASRD